MSTESNDRKYYLVRTIQELVEKSTIGVGWSDFDFSSPEYADVEVLVNAIDKDYGIGRRGNQVRRFRQIKKGDVIIVPLPWCVAIGVADDGLFFDNNYYSKDKANQKRVKFDFDENKRLKTINRTEFSEGFQRRLRVQGMTVNDISEFKGEIDRALLNQKEGKTFSWSNSVREMLDKQKIHFKKGLFKNIQNGQTNLQAGGIGLEHLVKELLIIEGYDAEVSSKRAFPSFADADVIASKVDRFDSTELLIQVKHHRGMSDDWGIRQLEEIRNLALKEYADYRLVLITSAEILDEIKKYANEKDILTIDGHELVDWIYDNIDELDENTKTKLGICEVPTLAII